MCFRVRGHARPHSAILKCQSFKSKVLEVCFILGYYLLVIHRFAHIATISLNISSTFNETFPQGRPGRNSLTVQSRFLQLRIRIDFSMAPIGYNYQHYHSVGRKAMCLSLLIPATFASA